MRANAKSFKSWLLADRPPGGTPGLHQEKSRASKEQSWYKVMCLTGVDYFSTLGYQPGIAALAADTDGTDGGGGRPDDPAGAFVDPTTLERARAAGLDPAAFLADNNSTGFFNGIGDLFRPGPTFTNVTDFRAIVVDGDRN